MGPALELMLDGKSDFAKASETKVYRGGCWLLPVLMVSSRCSVAGCGYFLKLCWMVTASVSLLQHAANSIICSN